jgi:hypothetical protein
MNRWFAASAMLFLVVACTFVIGVGAVALTAKASSGTGDALERIGGDAQFWRYHDTEHDVTCYLWGPDAMDCVRDVP